MPRNHWSDQIGTDGRIKSEPLAGWPRNGHIVASIACDRQSVSFILVSDLTLNPCFNCEEAAHKNGWISMTTCATRITSCSLVSPMTRQWMSWGWGPVTSGRQGTRSTTLILTSLSEGGSWRRCAACRHVAHRRRQQAPTSPFHNL